MTPAKRGKFIALEGIDGSGKSTQFLLLLNYFKKTGIKTRGIKFPQYGEKSAVFIEEYLAGKYGKDPKKVNPYAASLFYALDRFAASEKIKKWLAHGYLVVSDRFTDSNSAHQGGKIRNKAKRKKFIKWLYELEYDLLRIPKPDLVIIFDVPLAVSQQLISKTKKDSHEKSKKHLENTREAYLWLAKEFPQNHLALKCTDNSGNILEPQEILFQTINNILTFLRM